MLDKPTWSVIIPLDEQGVFLIKKANIALIDPLTDLLPNKYKYGCTWQNDMYPNQWVSLVLNNNKACGSSWIYMSNRNFSLWARLNLPFFWDLRSIVLHPKVTVLDEDGKEITCPLDKRLQ